MKRLLVVAVALLISGLMVASTVQAEPNAEPRAKPAHYTAQHFNGKFPAAGWWKVGGTPQQRTLYRDNHIWIVWNLAKVRPYGQVPLYWRAQVWYKNVSSRDWTFWCGGKSDPSQYKEHFKRGGRYIGLVRAERAFCTGRAERWHRTLQPGETFKDSALFHNVPWRRDRISLEWDVGSLTYRTAFVRPWARHLH